MIFNRQQQQRMFIQMLQEPSSLNLIVFVLYNLFIQYPLLKQFDINITFLYRNRILLQWVFTSIKVNVTYISTTSSLTHISNTSPQHIHIYILYFFFYSVCTYTFKSTGKKEWTSSYPSSFITLIKVLILLSFDISLLIFM